ncbi:CAP domain-containing protein [Campylobacter sp. FMV-PI01]|uniref:CAP domain-containing protein n=1 Tax=Campylobacter portucalensis TaxID=2608384 RepID=A0A6L5WJJ6_9BACT|nr:CAP domain-containing protein [Campylobacter portucalensis]MSN96612.1 CAP domain-containing protein [Campylobacter portucalensis]
MQKRVQKYKFIFLFLIAILFSSCKEDKNLKTPLEPTSGVTYTDPISYLNSIRMTSNLNILSKNEILSISALNHAKYTYENKIESHDESPNLAFFTGQTPKDRAFYVGYNSQISENLSINNIDAINSIDNLMSAIYHRFGFLDFSIDEIGWAEYGDDKGKNYVYNMGNSKFENFCKNRISDKGYGKFYTNICKDVKISIHEDKFKYYKILNLTPYIVYPNSNNTKAFFSREIPDPMPDCKITANPVSIEFNKFKSQIKMVSFEIFEDGKKLENTRILTKSNDPNLLLNDFQFALFYLKPFKFNQKYNVLFKYIQDKEKKEISWDFTTKTPKNNYFVVKNGDSLALKPDVWYDIFIQPNDCNDVSNLYNFSYNPIQKVEFKSIDTNLISIKINGYKNFTTKIKTDNNKIINLVLTQNSKGKIDIKILASIFLGAILLIYFILKKR